MLKEEVEIYDSIKIYLNNGNEIEGKLEKIGDNYIVISTSKTKKTIFDKLLGGWEIITNKTNNKSVDKIKASVTNSIEEGDIHKKKLKENDINIQIKQQDSYSLEKSNSKQKEKELKKKLKSEAKKNKTTKTFNSFEDWRDQLIKPIKEEQNQKMIPANGMIIKYSKDRESGYVQDKNEREFYFNKNSIIDKNLIVDLNKINSLVEQFSLKKPILFTIFQNPQKPSANYLTYPKKISQLLEESKELEILNRLEPAKALLNYIISNFPDNVSASDNLKKLNTKKNKYKKYPTVYEYDNFKKAKKYKDKKDYKNAIKYFKMALDNDEKIESCIKDLAITYLEMEEHEIGYTFLKDNLNKLPENITTYNFLENYFFAMEDYDNAIKYIDIIIENTAFQNKTKHLELITKKALCYIHLQEYALAKDILKKEKANDKISKLLDKIVQAEKSGDFEEVTNIMKNLDITSFTGGLSNFISNILENYSDYHGIRPKVVEKEEFNNSTLKEIKRIIESAGKARPRERAKYLLTEAKLLQLLHPENESYLKSILARYCNAMALNHISDNNMDIARFYYIEAFKLEDSWDSLNRQVALYFLTFIDSSSGILNNSSPAFDETIEKVLIDNNEIIWNGLLNIFIWNKTISSKLIKRIFNNIRFKKNAVMYLNKIDTDLNNDISYESFVNKWNIAIEKRKREMDKLSASLNGIKKIKNLEQLTDQLLNNILSFKAQWLTKKDIYRIDIVSKDILENLKIYLIQKTFDDKERLHNIIISQINQLINAIEGTPTQFSYENLISLLKKISKLLKIHFDKVQEVSSPKINVEIINDLTVVNKNRIVTIQLSISNSKECSPISELNITVDNTPDIKFINKNTHHPEAIKGGDKNIVKLSIEVSERIIKDKATTLLIDYNYKNRLQEEIVSDTENLSLRLYSEQDFEPLENVYAAIADSGPVIDKTMFYGRDIFIDNIVNSLLQNNSKCVIIYGQKRSGKSSVLYHLRKKIDESSKAFCINFSLGEIIEGLNSASFYYKIISEIEDVFEDSKIELNKYNEFSWPSFELLSKNPSIVFIETIKKIKKIISEKTELKVRKFILLIDEFTYLYTAILKGTISDSFMKVWKSLIEKNLFSAVLIGQDVMPKFKKRYSNEFGVSEDRRLTYLADEDARKLIEQPIWDKNTNKSRFLGNAVDSIIDYTSTNPYYIQIFCARIVDYMNKRKLISITEADIEEIADSFITGGQSLTDDKFDNLLTAGDADVEAISPQNTTNILRQIAVGSKNIGGCSRDSIELNEDKEYVDKILNDLIKREVISMPQKKYYKIQVRLFKEWLMKN